METASDYYRAAWHVENTCLVSNLESVEALEAVDAVLIGLVQIHCLQKHLSLLMKRDQVTYHLIALALMIQIKVANHDY